ncbi:hypothetical protein [Falsiroseomonas sp. E2-1-a20]|uniref:hypothetical protein n=1 Tax=Falsiroseomonas sp. E2-1-a20 TaxID=3239300 RepID=UPI003F2B52A3
MIRIEKKGEDFFVLIPRESDELVRGAIIMASIAHPPTRVDDPKTLKAYRGTCRFAIDAFLKAVPAAAGGILPYPEDILRISALEAKRIHDQTDWTVRRMIAAADTLSPEIESVVKGSKHSRTTRTLDRMIQDYFGQQFEDSEKAKKSGEHVRWPFIIGDVNFEQRVIRKSLPVLHIAAAILYSYLWVILGHRDKDEKIMKEFGYNLDSSGIKVPKFDYRKLVFHSEAQKFILKAAEDLESVVPFMQPAPRKGLIRIREL